MKQPRPLGIAAAVLAIMVTAGLAGCVGQESGTVAVYVAGSPSTEYDRVFVTVTKVEVHTSSDDDFDPQPYDDPDQPPSPPANQTSGPTTPEQNNTTSPPNSTQNATTPTMGSNNTTEPSDNGTDAGDNGTTPDVGAGAGWQTIVDEPSGITIEVTGTSGLRTLLGHADLPSDRYTQIRVEVIEAWGEDATSNRTVFDVPSGEFRTARSFGVSSNATTALTFEFDLDRSIVTAGESGKVIFKPVFAQVDVTYESQVESAPPTSPTGAPMPTTGLPGNETDNNTTATTGP